MELQLAVHFPGHFVRTFTRHIYIYICPNVHSCWTLVLLVLSVPCVNELASGNAERPVLCAQRVPQTRVPFGLCSADVFVRMAPTAPCLRPFI